MQTLIFASDSGWGKWILKTWESVGSEQISLLMRTILHTFKSLLYLCKLAASLCTHKAHRQKQGVRKVAPFTRNYCKCWKTCTSKICPWFTIWRALMHAFKPCSYFASLNISAFLRDKKGWVLTVFFKFHIH